MSGQPDIASYTRIGDEYEFSIHGYRFGRFGNPTEDMVADYGYDPDAFMLTTLRRSDGADLGVVFIDDDKAELVYGSAYDEWDEWLDAQAPL